MRPAKQEQRETKLAQALPPGLTFLWLYGHKLFVNDKRSGN